MENQSFNLNAYLEKINHNGKTDVSVETLRALHSAHVFNIPFENLDLIHNRPISLAVDDLFQKMVVNRRGGYCFEMNGLFSYVLKQLGFSVTNLLARAWINNSYFSAKSHHTMLVRIADACWIADVGFGGNGPIEPVLLADGVEQEQFGRCFKIEYDPAWGHVLKYKIQGMFRPLYAFTLEECLPVDYEAANYYTATFPTSFFRLNYLCTKPSPHGRITIYGNRLRIIQDGVETETPLKTDQEIMECLHKYFGL